MSDIIEAAVWTAYAKANPFLLGSDHTAALLAVLAAVTPLIRADALEEAAKMADGWRESAAIGHAIRALKEQP
jgi:hypothetical protein